MKYIVYCRKSTEAEDRQVLSIDSQESELQRIADRDGFVISKTFKESKSAKSSGRPIFNEMLKFIEKQGECVLLVWKPDRIARNMVDGGLTIELMDKGVVSLVLAQKPFDMGYLAVAFAVADAAGVTSLPPRVETGFAIIDKTNVKDPAVARFIYKVPGK